MKTLIALLILGSSVASANIIEMPFPFPTGNTYEGQFESRRNEDSKITEKAIAAFENDQTVQTAIQKKIDDLVNGRSGGFFSESIYDSKPQAIITSSRARESNPFSPTYTVLVLKRFTAFNPIGRQIERGGTLVSALVTITPFENFISLVDMEFKKAQ